MRSLTGGLGFGFNCIKVYQLNVSQSDGGLLFIVLPYPKVRVLVKAFFVYHVWFWTWVCMCQDILEAFTVLEVYVAAVIDLFVVLAVVDAELCSIPGVSLEALW